MSHLIRDTSRVASPSIRGYWFQLLHTIRVWLEIGDDEVIVAEGNEDIDRVCGSSLEQTEEQVKFRSNSLTQGNNAVAETILRYLSAFVFHSSQGYKFRGVLRTNAEIRTTEGTAFGAWISGGIVDLTHFSVELKALVEKSGGDASALQFVLRTPETTRAFIDAVLWAPQSDDVEQELSCLLKTRAPSTSPEISKAILLRRMLHIVSSENVADRTLRRIDADLALADCALEALQQSAISDERISKAALWSQASLPAVAVALFVDVETRLESSVDEARRTDRLLLRTRSSREILVSLASSVDFIVYASIRRQPGPRAERVCVRDAVRQSGYRHRPSSVSVVSTAKWLREVIACEWPNATFDSSALLLEFAEVVGKAIINDDQAFLRTLGTKLRWIHYVDEGRYITADRN